MKTCISRAWNHGDTTKRVGAVESLIWDYATELGELGHEGTIINTPDKAQIIRELSEEKYDFIHVHYDVSMTSWITFGQYNQMPN